VANPSTQRPAQSALTSQTHPDAIAVPAGRFRNGDPHKLKPNPQATPEDWFFTMPTIANGNSVPKCIAGTILRGRGVLACATDAIGPAWNLRAEHPGCSLLLLSRPMVVHVISWG
jgi:hypothetical protein